MPFLILLFLVLCSWCCGMFESAEYVRGVLRLRVLVPFLVVVFSDAIVYSYPVCRRVSCVLVSDDLIRRGFCCVAVSWSDSDDVGGMDLVLMCLSIVFGTEGY